MILFGEDNELYLSQKEMVEALVSCQVNDKTSEETKALLEKRAAETIGRGSRRGSSQWQCEKDPSDNRCVIVRYESLSDINKQKVKDRFGDPYSYVITRPIRDMVKRDSAAEDFYLNYRYDGDKVLSQSHVTKYTLAASWLNMINEATADKRALKDRLKVTIDQFYTHVTSMIDNDKIDLPTSYRRLKAKQKDYQQNGYQCLISTHLGNKKAAKISDEVSESVLLEMLANENQFDDVFIANQYNSWAIKNNYKPITPAAVGVHRRTNSELLTYEREGIAAFKDKFSKKIRGHRPSAPLYLVEHDDNHLDLFFQDETSKHRRYKAIVVMDSYNNYVLGYAYALELKMEVVVAAYANAMRHIHELTGGWFLPHETKSDRWAVASLTPFYQALGNYIPARLGNKHRGYIEQFFGSNHWKNCLKMGAKNYSGNNITALKRGVNADKLAVNQGSRPFIGNESIAQIEQFFQNLRHLKQANGLSKQEEWLQGWNDLVEDKKRQISEEQYLMKFGLEHNYRGQGVQITSKGVTIQLAGNVFNYELDQYRGDLIGKSVSVLYDPLDMNKVILTDHDKIRVMAHAPFVMPRALADHTSETHIYLKAAQQDQNQYFKRVVERSQNRKETLNQYNIDAESILQAGVLLKETKQLAEDRIYELPAASDTERTNFNPFEQM